jgi:CDP-diacylglycerol--glycerol-3-phosphate 3-phosphatidyltransferase
VPAEGEDQAAAPPPAPTSVPDDVPVPAPVPTQVPVLNIANLLTLSRLALVPFFLLALFAGTDFWRWTSALIFAVASITDWLDGYLARRRKQITVLGQLLDPIADKLLTTAAYVSLVQLDLARAWMVALIIGRELAVTGLRSVAHSRGVVMPASGLGKLKMVAQVVSILALMLAFDATGEMGRWLRLLGDAALWVVLALAMWSAVEYYQTFAAVVTGRTARAADPDPAPDPAGRPGRPRYDFGGAGGVAAAVLSSCSRSFALAMYSLCWNSCSMRSKSGTASAWRLSFTSESAR